MQIWLKEVKNHINEYKKEMLKHKIRWIIGAMVSVILFSVSCYYLFEGINKRFVLFTVLSLAAGGFIAFPTPANKVLTVSAIVLYLAMVPLMMFRRIEVPTHDMSRLQSGAQFVNVLIIILVFAVFLLLTQSTGIALGVGSTCLLLLFLINYYVHLFRGTGISLNDLKATRTAMGVMGNYSLSMNGELWYSILYFCVFITAGFWCRFSVKKKKYSYHIAVTAVSVLYVIFFGIFWNKSDYLESHQLHGHYWNMSENQALNGFLLSFGISMKENAMEKPAGYSANALQVMSEAIETGTFERSTEITPNIILIMNEAWADLRVLGNLETSAPYMPFVDSLQYNTVKGNLHVGVLGGLTANTEFEVLTGDTLSFLSVHTIPYQQQVNHPISSLASVLKEQGYQTMAMHPSVGDAWNRNRAYEYMGFEEFIDVNQFQTEYQYVRSFISDECNFYEIINRFEKKEQGKPLFLFDVTIQNHADYYGQIELPIEVEKVGEARAEEVAYTYDLQTYLNLMQITDEAFEKLVTYFNNVEEPTIICMFGDHQPNLHEGFYEAMFASSAFTEEEQVKRKYMTPYVIWSNYDSDFCEYGDMSANYLGAAVLECAGIKLPLYYQFLLDLQKKYPVLTHLGCMDAEGNGCFVTELEEDETILQYRMLQYNHLIDNNCRQALFSTIQ